MPGGSGKPCPARTIRDWVTGLPSSRRSPPNIRSGGNDAYLLVLRDRNWHRRGASGSRTMRPIACGHGRVHGLCGPVQAVRETAKPWAQCRRRAAASSLITESFAQFPGSPLTLVTGRVVEWSLKPSPLELQTGWVRAATRVTLRCRNSRTTQRRRRHPPWNAPIEISPEGLAAFLTLGTQASARRTKWLPTHAEAQGVLSDREFSPRTLARTTASTLAWHQNLSSSLRHLCPPVSEAARLGRDRYSLLAIPPSSAPSRRLRPPTQRPSQPNQS